MSKYIRTKDERIVELESICWVDKTDKETKKLIPYRLFQIYKYPFVLTETEILKEADTIEELCDEYVCENSLIDSSVRKVNGQIIDKYYKIDNARTLAKKGLIVYGAIWTDKGLIYVAKMNEKGELELL